MERLYNNIVLPEVWPPKNPETTLDRPLAVPYLQNKPDVIDISVGRQLFELEVRCTDLYDLCLEKIPAPGREWITGPVRL